MNVASSARARPSSPAATQQQTGLLARWFSPGAPLATWVDGDIAGVFAWDELAHRLVVREPEHEALACVEANGSFVVGASTSGALTVWDASGRVVARREQVIAQRHFFCATTFSPDGQHVVTHFTDDAVRVFSREGEIATLRTTERRPTVMFSRDSRKLFVYASAGDARVVDLPSGAALGSIATDRLNSQTVDHDVDSGRIAAVMNDTQVAVFDASTLGLVRMLTGSAPHVRFLGSDHLLVADTHNREDVATTVWNTRTWSRAWSRRDVSVFDDEQPAWPWVVGSTPTGYGVINGDTGATVATWRSSNSGCGHAWDWVPDGTLWFTDGGLVARWRRNHPPLIERTECTGTLTPLWTASLRRVVAFDTVWDVASDSVLARLEPPNPTSKDFEVHRWSRDERYVFGSGFTADDRQVLLAWHAETGRIVWEIPMFETTWMPKTRLPWIASADPTSFPALVEEATGNVTWLRPVITDSGAVELFAFDERCWDGPRPADAEDRRFERLRHCPGLLDELRRRYGVRTDPSSPRTR